MSNHSNVFLWNNKLNIFFCRICICTDNHISIIQILNLTEIIMKW